MATVKMRMAAVGIEAEECGACETRFARGQQMNGVEYENGEVAPWVCDTCLKRWKDTGDPNPPGDGVSLDSE